MHTDHQPLETIFKKTLAKTPKRLQRLIMRLQQFSVNVVYEKGTSIILAETLSRVPLPQVTTPEQPLLEIFRLERNDHQVNTQITSKTMAKLQEGTKADPVMNSLERTIVIGWPLEKKVFGFMFDAILEH